MSIRISAAALVTILSAFGAWGQQPLSSPSQEAVARVERQKEFDARRSTLAREANAWRELRERDPDRYLELLAADLEARERLAAEFADLQNSHVLRYETATASLRAGHYVRFGLKRPLDAIHFYAAAERNGHVLGGFAVADTYQFDLLDEPKALAVYRRLLAAKVTGRGPRLEHAEWGNRWLAAQIAFLETGARFTGTVGDDDLGGAVAALQLGLGAMGGEEARELASLQRKLVGLKGNSTDVQIDRNEVARTLDSMPASAFTLLQTAGYASLLPDAGAIRIFLARHDPAGYASACLFALVRRVEGLGDMRPLALLLPGLAMNPLGTINPIRAAAAEFGKQPVTQEPVRR